MDTLVSIIVIALFGAGCWYWASVDNTNRTRTAIRRAIERRTPEERSQLRRDLSLVTCAAHLKHELLLRNPLNLYSRAIQKLCAEEVFYDYRDPI